jgi:TonB family protein
MLAGKPERGWFERIRRFDPRGPRIQASIFQNVGENQETGFWSEVDWVFLRHPLQFLKEEMTAPETQASLFHYLREDDRGRLRWRDFLDAVRGGRDHFLVSTLFTDAEGQSLDTAEFRMRRMGARFASVFVHTLILAGAALFAYRGSEALPPQEARVFINPSPVYFPFESTGPDGGGGGGGGKMEKLPASGGRMPDTTRVQLVPPDPADPQPLIPAEDLMAATPSVQMPIDIFQDQSLPIGDIEAPPNDHGSSGPGSGGGIGSGFGTGVGSGTGPGVGPGSGGGMGGGAGGGIGSGVGPYVVGGGVRPPVPLAQPLPLYTEDARKARVEGLVLVQAIVRKDGTVDSFKVIRGLGYGLDESAISTIATRWRFKPGTLNGVPVDVQANIEVSFRLY